MGTTQIGICIAVALFVITAVVTVLLNANSKENFRKCVCGCSEGGRECNCQDTEVVGKMYDKNVFTEFTNFPSKDWSGVSPGDVDFPISQGCRWPDTTNERKWVRWDYTDFGS